MKRIIAPICFFLNTLSLSSQSYEFALCGGLANYSGDLTEDLMATLVQTRGGGGAYFRYDFSNMFSLKLQYLFLQVGAHDRYASESWQRQRDLHFRTRIHELSFLGQINLKGFVTEYPGRWNPVFNFGLNVFDYKPRAQYGGRWVSLRELGTEGQGLRNFSLPYKKRSAGLAFGFGLRYFLTPKMSTTVEWLSRQTLTDYLDDASGKYADYDLLLSSRGLAAAELGNKIKATGGSQRANSVDKDWYSTLMLSVAFHLGKEFGYNEFVYRKKPVRCPDF